MLQCRVRQSEKKNLPRNQGDLKFQMAVSGLLEKFCKRVVISHILQTNGAPFANFLYSFYSQYLQVFFKKEKS
jgi:hypothetical protein